MVLLCDIWKCFLMLKTRQTGQENQLATFALARLQKAVLARSLACYASCFGKLVPQNAKGWLMLAQLPRPVLQKSYFPGDTVKTQLFHNIKSFSEIFLALPRHAVQEKLNTIKKNGRVTMSVKISILSLHNKQGCAYKIHLYTHPHIHTHTCHRRVVVVYVTCPWSKSLSTAAGWHCSAPNVNKLNEAIKEWIRQRW